MKLHITETQILTLVQNIHAPLHKRCMGKTCSFDSQCGPTMNMTYRLIKKTSYMMGIDALSDNSI